MNLSLSGRRAIVCGSTSGIGRACAQLLAERGASVVLAARDEEKLISTVNSLDGDDHSYICADFNDPENLRLKTIDHINKTGVIHILMNNSGGPPGGPLIEANPDEFEIAFNRHVISSHILTQTVVPGMKEKGYGRIINIISTSVNQVIPGLGVSNTIRGAVAQWVKTLAIELGPYGITANNVLPGYIDTDRLKNLLEKSAKDKNITYDQNGHHQLKN
jgi:3-oxoacyl-[acyl-carrier protein] reductase